MAEKNYELNKFKVRDNIIVTTNSQKNPIGGTKVYTFTYTFNIYCISYLVKKRDAHENVIGQCVGVFGWKLLNSSNFMLKIFLIGRLRKKGVIKSLFVSAANIFVLAVIFFCLGCQLGYKESIWQNLEIRVQQNLI